MPNDFSNGYGNGHGPGHVNGNGPTNGHPNNQNAGYGHAANGSPGNVADTGVEDILEPIAIVGMALRFPQDATDPESFWKLLCEARSAMTTVPADRFNLEGFYHPNHERGGSINIRGGHFIKDDIAAFDAPFFTITPNEAASTDPQQRGFTQVRYLYGKSGKKSGHTAF